VQERLREIAWTHALTLPSLRAALHHNVDSLRRVLAEAVAGLSPRGAGRGTPPAVVADVLAIFALGLIASSALGTQRASSSQEAALKVLVRTLIGETTALRRQPRNRAAPTSNAKIT
jgi:hypothetical protein